MLVAKYLAENVDFSVDLPSTSSDSSSNLISSNSVLPTGVGSTSIPATSSILPS